MKKITNFKITLLQPETEEILYKEVEGKIIKINPLIKTFIFKNSSDSIYPWNISEVTTGFQICTGDTKKEVIAKSKNLLKNKTKEDIDEAILKAKQLIK